MSAGASPSEQPLGRVYDARMLLRLWPYVRPYMWILALDLVASIPLFLLELAPAWLIGHGLDSVFGGEGTAQAAPVATAIGGMTARFSSWSSAVLEPPALFSPLSWLAVLYAAAVFMLAGHLQETLSLN